MLLFGVNPSLLLLDHGCRGNTLKTLQNVFPAMASLDFSRKGYDQSKYKAVKDIIEMADTIWVFQKIVVLQNG